MWVQSLRVTKGSMRPGGKIDVPTFRAVAPGTSGEAVGLFFVYDGRSAGTRALASGQERRQIGLKLRAANGCNLVYVMWRLDPRSEVEISTKINPGARTHAECGARGYTKLAHSYAVPQLRAGESHSMYADIVGGDLRVWIDNQFVWSGALPYEARSLTGPAGFRSDNVAYTLTGLWAPAGRHGAATAAVDGED